MINDNRAISRLEKEVWIERGLNEIKSVETLKTFEQIMKQWNGIQCARNVCQNNKS